MCEPISDRPVGEEAQRGEIGRVDEFEMRKMGSEDSSARRWEQVMKPRKVRVEELRERVQRLAFGRGF